MVNKENIEEYVKKNIMSIITFTLLFLITNNISRYFRLYQGSAFQKIKYMFKNPTALIIGFPISFNKFDLTYGLLIGLIGLLIVIDNKSKKKKYRTGVEHGSAEWGKPEKDLKGMFNEKDDSKNIIFTENTKMALDNMDTDHFKHHRNKNIIIIGGSGSGKTRTFVKPNIMQMNSDFVITDPKGDILNDVGYMLRKNDYNIGVLNLVELDKSMRYNPLAYIKKEEDILKVVETLIKNTQSPDAKDDFWVDTEKLLYQALIGAMMEYFYPEEQNLGTLADLISAFETKENDENYVSAVDEMFIQIEEHNPNSFALKQYKGFKISAGETAKSILISCATRLAPINIPAVRNLLSSNEIEFEKLGNDIMYDDNGNIMVDESGEIIYRPNALFVIIPDTDKTFNFIASMMYTQMFNTLVTIADTEYAGEGLPRHVRCIFDEFANTGQIPDFEILISTIRSREISASIILQAAAQLNLVYGEHEGKTIIGNCDTLTFLGGKEVDTLDMLSTQLGSETIDDYNTSKTKSQSDSFGQNYSKLGRELMKPDELQRMEREQAIVMITGLRPFIDKKYVLESHPNYDYHGSSPKINRRTGEVIKEGKYWFDIDKYITTQRQIISNEKKLIELRKKAKEEAYKKKVIEQSEEIKNKTKNIEEKFNAIAEERLDFNKVDKTKYKKDLQNYIKDEDIKIEFSKIKIEDQKQEESFKRTRVKGLNKASAIG